MINLDTNDRTAPTMVWNAYHAARNQPDEFQKLRQKGITADVLRHWAHRPDMHATVITALGNPQPR